MHFEKWEDCPQCNCTDARWHYDAQFCGACGWPDKNEYGLHNPKKHPYNAVKEFHEKFGHPLNKPFINLDCIDTEIQELITLRYNLIREEFLEFEEAFADNNEIEICDALCDIIYVIYGFAIAMGWDINAMFEEVHRSNMSKLGADGKPVIREDGKILKGENYSPPNLAQFFERKKDATDSIT